MTVQAAPGHGASAAVTALEAVGVVAAQAGPDAALAAVVGQAARISGARRSGLALLDARGGVSGFVPDGADAEPWDADLLVVPIRADGRDQALLHLAGAPDDGGFDSRTEVLVRALVDTGGQVLSHLCALRRSERRRRWLEAATHLCHALLEVPQQLSLSQVARVARSASGAEAAAVVALRSSGPPVVREYDGPAGRVDDVTLVEAVVAAFAAERPAPVVEHHVVAVPLDERLAEPSALVLVLPAGADVTEERELLASYATQAGLALDRAQAIREREELAVVAERERIGRELHDTVVQRLFAAGLRLQALRDLPADLLDEGLDTAVDALDAVIREIRATVLELGT